MRKTKVDRAFLFWIIVLTVFGFLIFSSASLGLLARGGGLYSDVALSQTFFGLFLGTLALLFLSRIHFRFWRKHAFAIFVVGIVATLLVFIPGLGLKHAGATRWIILGDLSFQPSELLKIAFVIYLAAWISGVRDKIKTFKFGLLPLLILLGICGLLVLSQPDTDTFAVIIMSGLAMFLVGGGKWRHVALIFLIAVLGLFIIASFKPYIKQRLTTFIKPAENAQGSSYQIQQSLIAIGSGQMTGRGYGQSIQKFYFLPEPIGDSIFAVAAEEFGFVGALGLILAFVSFSIQGMRIAARTDDSFGRLVVTGVIVMIISQAFVNIAAMLNVLPLAGLPLPFVSHGGTALLFTLAEVGIVLNISRYQKKT
jgi:cell division protein FtsW